MTELNKIQVIKMLRELTNCGLREAKIAADSCDQLPMLAEDWRKNEQAVARKIAIDNIKKQMVPLSLEQMQSELLKTQSELQEKRERIAYYAKDNLDLKEEVKRLDSANVRMEDDIHRVCRERDEARAELEGLRNSLSRAVPQKPSQNVVSQIKRAIVDLTAGRKFDAVEKLLEALTPEKEKAPQVPQPDPVKWCEDCDHYDEDDCRCMCRKHCTNHSQWTRRIPF